MRNPCIHHLHLIADHCPKAMVTYLWCNQLCGEKESCTITRKETEAFNTTFTRTRNDLRTLAREGVLEYSHIGSKLHVILAND